MAFSDDIMGIINKGIAASKDILSKAADKAQELGKKGLIKVELMQLESHLEKSVLKLGHLAYLTFMERGSETLTKSSEKVQGLLREIEDIKENLEKKRAEYDAVSA